MRAAKDDLSSHVRFMRAAIVLARKGLGSTSPNPAVGAVIVRNKKIIAGGYHRKAGLPHAEVEALRVAGAAAKGAALYVTLEPCCKWGRTPPCTEAIIRSGIKKVVAGMMDPNPGVSGRGTRALRAAGIEVVSGVLDDECNRINEGYIKHITTGLPFVTLKLASTLDGRIATSMGESKWITGREARGFVHRLRAINDAVMVGVSTVLKDDPELTVRLARGRDPARVVLDSNLRIPLSAKVFKEGARLLIFTIAGAGRAKASMAADRGAEVITVAGSKDGVDIKRVLREIGKRGVTSVLVEGGGRVAASLLKKGLADKLVLFISPIALGSDGLPSIGPLGIKRLKDAPRLERMASRKIGPDIVLEGYFGHLTGC
ncbi:MAG: bifunctional diaminohydroxyphosphoribosylaminopyrimidine deaminase/5-amino-6-(5-phosphoribosylamino)uracil reductase RibD [Deltaproteobacteria bacterium]|nr:bifunctional diaminohydroxyphosphoribosylaminopyrimidine deaminase/5-amino-6-(5-phosphoribosylamino)uracil reductase RibD [Deltaproteobacteria bacterium]